MGRFIYCLILHEDQNISSWELDMTIRLLRLDVGVQKLATTEALERLQSTAVLHVVSPYRELGRLAEVRAVLQCSAQLQSSAITTHHRRPCSPATPAPTTILLSLCQVSGSLKCRVSGILYLVGLRNICCCLTTSYTKTESSKYHTDIF